MTGLDFFALIVLMVLAGSFVAVACVLAALPGKIAARRGHGKADAVRVAGWLGLVNGVSWLVAMIWAFTESESPPPAAAEPPAEVGS